MAKVYCISPYREEIAHQIKDGIVLIYDTFRASTTILFALWRGFRYVIPVKDPQEGLTLAKKYGALTAGESKGRKIRKYHFSNSPYQVLTTRNVTDYLVIRSTNGTRAIIGLMKRNEIVIASTVNSKWAANYAFNKAKESKKRIFLVAVGRKSPFGSLETFEDRLGVALTANYLKLFGAHLDESCCHYKKEITYAKIIKKIANNRKIIRLAKAIPSSYPKDLLLTGLIDILPIIGRLEVKNDVPMIKMEKC